MEFTGISDVDLSAALDAAKGNAAMAFMVAGMQAELKARADAAIKAEATEALRTLADDSATLLSNVALCKVTEVSGGIARKNAARTLVALIEAAYDVSALRARHAVDALMSPKTDVKTVADGVAYAIKHAKSTVYSA